MARSWELVVSHRVARSLSLVVSALMARSDSVGVFRCYGSLVGLGCLSVLGSLTLPGRLSGDGSLYARGCLAGVGPLYYFGLLACRGPLCLAWFSLVRWLALAIWLPFTYRLYGTHSVTHERRADRGLYCERPLPVRSAVFIEDFPVSLQLSRGGWRTDWCRRAEPCRPSCVPAQDAHRPPAGRRSTHALIKSMRL